MNKTDKTYIGKDGLLYCARCNTPKEKIIPNKLMGNEFKISFMCECERSIAEQEELKRIEQERAKSISRNRAVCFNDKKMYEWTFANSNASSNNIYKAKVYADNWELMRNKGCGLLLWGNVGSGKTYMAACIANAILDLGKTVCMRDFSQISNISVFEEEDYVNSLCGYELLILDDLGAERNSEFAIQNVFNVINRRWESGKPLIVTTNLQLSSIENPEDCAHERIYDRILSMCSPVRIIGESKRMENAKNNRDVLKKIFEKGGEYR